MIRHVLLIRFNANTDQTTRLAVKQAFEKLPALIPQVKSYSVGVDLGLLPGNADVAVIAGFANQADFLTYSQHAAHAEVIYPVCGQVMESYSTAQFEVPE
jgi:Stress responsive A/B Barrel Domain